MHPFLRLNLGKCLTVRHYHHFSISLLSQKPHTSNQFYQILSHTITSGLFSDPFISSKLLLSSHPSFAPSLFAQIQNPNVYSWNFMFRIYALSSSPHHSIYLYNLMRRNGLLPDNYTFPFVLKACNRLLLLRKGQELHSSSLKFGFEFDVFVQNSLISMYSVCGMVESATAVFDLVPVLGRDVVTWNSIISGYLQCDLCTSALEVFRNMWERSVVRPDAVTLVSALTACGKTGDLDLGRRIHGFAVVSGFVMDVYMGSSLIGMYAKGGHVKDARRVFDQMHERNVVCWTTIIASCVQSSLFKEAIELFRKMQVEGVRGDEATIASVVSACGHLGALDQGRWVHAYCERNDIQMNLAMSNAFIDMYAKCGEISKALEIFHELAWKDVFSWTVMISGLAMNGKSDEALKLFNHMEVSSEVRPNEITFLGVLAACSHGGLVDEGFHHFDSMIKTYNLTPRIEHYGCIVDLLVRANLLSTADRFVRAMPIEPDVVIWRSLLSCARTNANIELAEFAVRKILDFEPRKCGAHVLLSNAYAAASRWGDVKKVRKAMGFRGIRKQPGCSFLEINGAVHEFMAADTSHPHSDIIYEIICGINHLIRFKGYDSGELEGD